ncbi:unnamed protein product [Microthlaspi erraticum]|uniref:Uncharacterized protein n=1 Tax=Microthlaspi erraticum TaxID=1685480 RepID=A0A6D2KYU6_9BRAS|nr:unnamed protein product [Microthlaspi erraticum]CAA7057667.1 unnamed protein product [Microthlaspi erraticum]CAA7059325.1 unnamed protein product [Microthlaspi erraticum]
MYPPCRGGLPARIDVGRGGPTRSRAWRNQLNRSRGRGDGMHQHISCSKSYAKVKYDMIGKLNKGRLFGLGTTQMEFNDPIDPAAAVVLARFERDMNNLSGAVNFMSQQMTAMCEAKAVTVPPGLGAEHSPNPSQQLHTQASPTDPHIPSPTSII